jgi:hypothetical protein
MSSATPPRCLARSIGRVAAALVLVAGLAALTGHSAVRADEGCDGSEQVACIALPSDSSPQPGSPIAASGAAGASAVAAPAPGVLCAQGACCPPLPLGVASPQTGSAAVAVPPGGYCPYPQNWCYPLPPYAGVPGGSVSSGPAVAAVPAPGFYPPQAYCSPYRVIYTTINLGNAADVRALRTLSTDTLRPYWRAGAYSDIASQVSQLQSVGDYATPRLYSIQVQSANVDLLSSTATVRTLEHWLYEEHSQADGSLVYSQDEWVTNRYTLSFQSNGWYITSDAITLTSGPQPYPLAGAGG